LYLIKKELGCETDAQWKAPWRKTTPQKIRRKETNWTEGY
jgi:hypothetical protein